MRRLMVYDRTDKPLGDIAEADVFALVRRATINGEHALEVTTTRKLGKGQRILMQDGRQIWHEYVVDGVDELHGAGRRPVGTYTCVWSIQHDLQGVRVSVMPGVQTPVTAGEALARLLGTTRRWTVGTVTNTSTGGASMYDTDAWSALSTLVKTWGGEVDTTIEVDQAGVVSRKVDLYAQQGDQEAKRRYDFGADIKSVRRTMPDGPLYCRMTPRGKGEETEGGGYGRKVTIESVNDGKDYLELASMVPLAKLPDGTGGWEYPTLEVENGDCETPAELLAWARDVLEDTLTPQVGYDVDVLQAAREGIDLHGVSLGDAVQVVDRSFGDDGLRVSARVVEMTVDELEDRDITIKLGYISDGFTSLAAEISQVRDTVVNINGGTLSTADYLDRLISRLNNEINASGGYTYITQGQGIRTYDTAVTDPLVGDEASKVVEIKGGSIRIADSRTAQGEWDWKTVFVSGHIAAELVTAAQITTGYIGNASGSNYWNLDNNYLTVGRGEINADVLSGGTIKLGGSNNKNGVLRIYDSAGTQVGYITNSGANLSGVFVNRLNNDWIRIDESYVKSGHESTTDGHIDLSARYGSDDYRVTMKAYQGSIQLQPSNYVQVEGSFYVTGSKNRIVKTDNYSKRLLYSYETASPYFGDLGSGIIGDDGVCIISIDDIFSETASTNTVYHVFLQSLGGDVYVSEKRKECFVVIGEPGTEFEWEIKARQLDYEPMRLEQGEIFLSAPFVDDYENLDHDYVSEIEALYEEGEEYETAV
jgi:hypothetical protein